MFAPAYWLRGVLAAAALTWTTPASRAASRTWRRLKGTNQLPKLIAGVRFNDGIEVIQMPANRAA